jgi:hypothetical protein
MPNVPTPPDGSSNAKPAATEPPAATDAAPKKASSRKKTAAGRFRAVASPIHHPYQNISVPVSGSVAMDIDSWVQVQLDAKVIIAVKE